MRTNNLTKVPAEMPAYRFGLHWNTIQAYLIPGIEDDIGAKFVNAIAAVEKPRPITIRPHAASCR